MNQFFRKELARHLLDIYKGATPLLVGDETGEGLDDEESSLINLRDTGNYSKAKNTKYHEQFQGLGISFQSKPQMEYYLFYNNKRMR